MLTEILDRWEVLRELQQQKATWQQRWDRAQSAYDDALQSIDAHDADRLRRVLAETLTTLGKTTPIFGVVNAGEHQHVASAPLNNSKASLVEPTAACSDPTPASTIQTTIATQSSPTVIQETTVTVSSPEKEIVDPTVASKSVQAESAPSEPEPTAAEPVVESEEEYSLDDLLTWATETIGDGMTENALFQELRKSKYVRQARQLFDSLKELDAFYENSEGVIQVQSLRALGL